MTLLRPVISLVLRDETVRAAVRLVADSMELRTRAYCTAHEFLAAFDPAVPGCAVVCIQLPGMSGLDLQDYFLSEKIVIPLIFITDGGSISLVVRAVKGGAVDVIEKPLRPKALHASIGRALEQDARGRQEEAQRGEIIAHLRQLTPCEREVMKLVVTGKTNKEIAATLNRSPKTVEVHRAHVMRTMQVDSLAELVRLSLAAGAVPGFAGWLEAATGVVRGPARMDPPV